MKKIIVFLVSAIIVVYAAIGITYLFDGTQDKPNDYMIIEYRLVDKDGIIIPDGSGNPITVSQKIGLYYNSVTEQNETKKNTTKLKKADIFDYEGFEMMSWEVDGLPYRPGTYLRAGITKPEGGKIEAEPSWIQGQYTVKFESHGSINPAKETIWFNDKFGQIITSNSYIDKDDHDLVGWFTSPTDGIHVTPDTVFSKVMLNLVDKKTNTITLHAHWQYDGSGDPVFAEYTVAFYPNGGSGNIIEQVFTEGETKPLNGGSLKREGYYFAGWNTMPDGSGTHYNNGTSMLVTSDMYLYAQWTPVPVPATYIIIFDPNGGSGGKGTQAFTEGVSQALDGGIPVRDGYDFICWNLERDGSGQKDYYNGVTTTVEGSNTLYAKWSAVASTTYKLTFNPNGGTGGNGYQSFEKDVYRILNGGVPTRNGYTFVCWNTNADGKGTDYYNGDSIKLYVNSTYYAKWVAAYTITFNPNGGVGGNGTQIFGVDEVKILDGGVPTRSGYNFVCWNTKADGTGDNYYNGVYTSVLGSNTLYAKWAQEASTTYVLTFNPNGGTGGKGTQIFTAGASQSLNGGIPTRTGYTFVCWTLNPDGTGGDYHNGENRTITENTTIYAKWSSSYTLIFDPNGGTGGKGTQTFTQGVSQPLDGGVPTRAGYTFVCWTLYPDGTGNTYYNGVSTTLEGNNTIYAKWSLIAPTTYVLTFNPNGGTGGYGTQTFAAGVSQSLNGGTPTRSGYSFVCWNTSADGNGTNYNNGASLTLNGNTTFYAKWSLNAPTTYVLTFNPNGGTGGKGTQTFTAGVSQSVDGGTPTRSGYNFVCWNTSADGNGTNYYNGAVFTLNGNTTFYAKWSLNAPTTYVLTFDPNGGTGGNGTQTFTPGVSQLLNGGVPTRTGYTFVCWTLNPDGTGGDYYNGVNTTLEGSNTVYAKWSANTATTYILTFDANGGTGGKGTQTFTEGVSQALNGGTPTRAGYTFVCWTLNPDGTGGNYYNGVSTTLEGSNTVYAKWSKN